MDTKNIITRSVAAVVLFTLFSCILDRDFSMDNVANNGVTGLVFGILYAAVTWAWFKYKNRKDS